MPDYLTTREVAALLRIKERKIYELVAEKAIPASRVTGKLLFPKDMIDAWVRREVAFRDGAESLANRPLVMAGSHDPLLEWAIRASECEFATLFEGSIAGLKRPGQGRAVAAGLHVYEPEDVNWNRGHVDSHLHGQPYVLVEWCVRKQGLVVAPGNPRSIRSVADLKGIRLASRQSDSGSRHLLDHLLRQEGLSAGSLDMVSPPARNEAEVANLIADGKAMRALPSRPWRGSTVWTSLPCFQSALIWRCGDAISSNRQCRPSWPSPAGGRSPGVRRNWAATISGAWAPSISTARENPVSRRRTRSGRTVADHRS